MSGGELITKPITFTGKKLSLNFATSAAGSVTVELQNEQGEPLPGFSLDDCDELFGDTVDRNVVWKGSTDVASLVGKVVRIRFRLRDADVYSFHFHN